MLSACHENLEERAEREAREFTEKNCPTPIVNYSRTDSVTFDKQTKTYTYYCSFWEEMDNASLVSNIHDELRASLKQQVVNNTEMQTLKDAQFNFGYVVHSGSNPDEILFVDTITPREYNRK